MKPMLFLTLPVALILLTGCNNPEEIGPWPDGSTLWAGAGNYSDSSLAWSPYGEVLLFTTYGNNGSPCLFGTSGGDAPSMRTFSSYDEFVGPTGSWNEEQGRIAYAAIHDDGTAELRTIPWNSTSVEVLLNDSLPHMYPGWNPDGDSLVFCTMQGDFWELWIAAYETELEPQPLFQPSADCLRPSYSPDGEWILFQYREADDSDIWLVRPDGSDPHVVLDGSATEIHPCWGPGNGWLAFSSDRSGNPEIWIYNIDTDELVQVTDDPSTDCYPAWNPVFEWIAFSSDRHSGIEGNFDIFSIHEPDIEY